MSEGGMLELGVGPKLAQYQRAVRELIAAADQYVAFAHELYRPGPRVGDEVERLALAEKRYRSAAARARDLVRQVRQ